ncbi:MAG: YbfB/YjiJ family MFS transporter [Pseudomonadota bacterium]
MANHKAPASAQVHPAALTLAGLLSLAAAMGIGRFAFTPMLPLMIRDGQLDLAYGGWLAAANYAGYLAGAVTAARLRISAAALGLLALLATAALTAAMAWPFAPAWLLWRFLAGMASAWAFIATAVWCLGALARQPNPLWANVVYTGVGGGIALAGLYCLAGGVAGTSARSLWLQLGALALVLSVPVMLVARRLQAAPPPAQAAAAAAPGAAPATRGIVLCYGVMGFGYILPATFLPVLARGVIDDPRWFGLAWPVFGATAVVSTLLSGWWLRRASRLQVWAVTQAAMGLGALLPSLWLNGWTIGLSALLVGGTFMVITLAGVQEIRARVSGNPTLWVSRMTTAFAIGQIAGPASSALLLRMPSLAAHGLDLALQAAAAASCLTAWWLWRLHRAIASTHHQDLSHAR